MEHYFDSIEFNNAADEELMALYNAFVPADDSRFEDVFNAFKNALISRTYPVRAKLYNERAKYNSVDATLRQSLATLIYLYAAECDGQDVDDLTDEEFRDGVNKIITVLKARERDGVSNPLDI